MSTKVHVNNIGTNFDLYVKENGNSIDISGATSKQIIFGKPDSSKLTKTADFITDGTDGGIRYTTQSGDLNTVGIWRIQAFIAISGGSFYSDIQSFQVLPNL